MTRLLLSLCLLLAGPAVAAPSAAYPDLVEDALAYTLTDRTKASRLLEDALEHGEGFKEKERTAVLLHAGEQRRLLGDYEEARKWFEQVQTLGSKPWELQSARLGLALVAAVDGFTPEVVAVLDSTRDKDVLATQSADRYLILTVRAARSGDSASVRTYSELALTYGQEDPKVEERVRAHLEALVDEDSNALVYQPPRPASQPEEVLGPMSDIDKAEKAAEAGNEERARTIAERILADDAATPEDRAAAEYLIARLDGATVRAGKIGVLLPLSDKYLAAGKQAQTAFEFGYQSAQGRASLIFVDSGSTPETAVKALERLVLEEGVIAVAGPLLTDEADAVAQAAEALRVPLVCLSQGLVPADDSRWVFQAAVTPQRQIEALVDFAMDERGMDAFAIFAPDTNYGHTAAVAFQDEVEGRKGQVTIVEFYDATANDLIPFAKALGRKDYEGRRDEFYRLRREAEAKGGNPDRVVLPPILDFDALFVPDTASRIPIAAAALAYEEFPLGDFQTTRGGVTVPLLGLSAWNSPALVTGGGPYVRGAVFTDAFWPDDAAGMDFVAAWGSTGAKAPTALEAVMADAGRLVAQATRAGADTRPAFRQALLDARVEGSATGAESFDPDDREARRNVRLLTITADAILPVGATASEIGAQNP